MFQQTESSLFVHKTNRHTHQFCLFELTG